MELLIGIVIALIFGAACGTIASNKGRKRYCGSYWVSSER